MNQIASCRPNLYSPLPADRLLAPCERVVNAIIDDAFNRGPIFNLVFCGAYDTAWSGYRNTPIREAIHFSRRPKNNSAAVNQNQTYGANAY